MTEISERTKLRPVLQRFVVHWGEMGVVWGVNRSVAQIHALLFLTDQPLTAEDIAEELNLARSNVSSSLRELISWSLIRREHVLGDRRDFYVAEADMFEMVRRIAEGRKAREIDPTLSVLDACVAEAANDKRVPAIAKRRLSDMHAFVKTVDKSFSEICRLPNATLYSILKMGGALARGVPGSGKFRKKVRSR